MTTETTKTTSEDQEIPDIDWDYFIRSHYYEGHQVFKIEDLYKVFRKRFLEELFEYDAFDDPTTQALARKFT